MKEIEIYSFKMDNREIKEYLYEYLKGGKNELQKERV